MHNEIYLSICLFSRKTNIYTTWFTLNNQSVPYWLFPHHFPRNCTSHKTSALLSLDLSEESLKSRSGKESGLEDRIITNTPLLSS